MMVNELLASAGLRRTQRRIAVLEILSGTCKPMTADNVHIEAIKIEPMGLSTTYRVLSQLTEHGLLLKNEGGDGRSYYQLASAPAHLHTLHCISCGNMVPIEGCPLASLQEQLCKETGFHILGHSLTFTGICPACQKK